MSGPILVFDSGIGGLSVMSEIRKQLPQHDYCYLFDNARLPYGNLSEQELIRGCVALITQQAKRLNASIVIVACNTASTLVLPQLRQSLTIPIVGVVPAIKPAAQLSKKKHIGLLATPGTVKRDYTQELINQFAGDCQVELFGTSELVLLAEQHVAGKVIDKSQLKAILLPIIESDIDVLVLGCTHFPMIAKEISDCIGAGVTLLDSGEAIAKRVRFLLSKEHDGTKQLQTCFTKGITEGLKAALVDYGFSDFSLVTITD
ncbi:glutamate racemase [Shewanella inventionis]|uniref:Glutamate racemase n=1 Tax=Shewanella inventionis TaxID=1738770 RepID=A0ABQ1JQ09_9GAMM|nr:glutamate racemase [Shewanella inventionis]MCL1159104.1 glutamate racemase [Shewanella inventionis]UAL43830.1 glutamate racemase [Shewanella inventionis]GGB71796.1 glutamate racemase [Shewanella inventionis]